MARAAIGGATIQRSDYDAATGSVTLQIVNLSSKDITALDIRTAGSENVIDFLTKMLTVAEARANGEEVSDANGVITGNGALQPGKIFTHTMSSHSRAAEITVVIYADGTAEASDPVAFDTLAAQRKGLLLAMQKTNEAIKKSLADPTVKDHFAAIRWELNQLAIAYRQQADQGDEVAAFAASFLGSQRLPKTESELPAFVTRGERRIAGYEPHTHLAVQP